MDVAWAAHKSVTAVALMSHMLSHSVTNTRHSVKKMFTFTIIIIINYVKYSDLGVGLSRLNKFRHRSIAN